MVNSLEEFTQSAEAVEDEVLTRLGRDAIKDAVSILGKNYKNVIILRYFHDLSYRDIAKQLKLNDSTVKTRLNRAKGKLYNLLS